MEQGRRPVEDYVVGSLPSLIYIPNFITEIEQSELLHHVCLSYFSSFCLIDIYLQLLPIGSPDLWSFRYEMEESEETQTAELGCVFDFFHFFVSGLEISSSK